jgi:hypothetical protein
VDARKALGIPSQSSEEQKQQEVVKAPEFDLTKFAKFLAVAVGILAPALAGGLNAFGITVTPPMVVAALGVVAASFLGMSFIAAVDIAARAFLSGEGSAQKKDEADDEESGSAEVIAAPAGMQVWLGDGGGPHPVSAMSSDGKKVTSYLVVTGSSQERSVDGKQVKAIDGTVKWCDAGEVQAIRADGWP